MKVIQHVPLLEWVLLVSMSIQQTVIVVVAENSNIVDVDSSMSQFARVSGVAQAFFTYNWANLVSLDDLDLLSLSSSLPSSSISSQRQDNEKEEAKEINLIKNISNSIRGGSTGGNDMNPLHCRSKKHSVVNNPAGWYNRMSLISTASATAKDDDDDDKSFDDNEFHFLPRNNRGRIPSSKISSRTQVAEPSPLSPPPLPSYNENDELEDGSTINPESPPLPHYEQGGHSSSKPSRATHPLHLYGNTSDGSISEADEEEYLEGHLYHTDKSSAATQSSFDKNDERFPHSPIVYRYFGRSRVRTHTSDSIPFIFLGPSVDHWKKAGQVLASRGFNVMACERVQPSSEQQEQQDGSKGKSKKQLLQQSRRDEEELQVPRAEEGHNLVLSILDALKWSKAILVGCDNEAAIAIEAALRLAPDRVAGLVLCGDLSSADKVISELQSQDADYRIARNPSLFSIDKYLREHLDCPFTVVWDGDIQPSNNKGGTSVEIPGKNRCLILGGGIAPHRRVPEHFAWVLTRFVEEQVASRKNADIPPLISPELTAANKDGGTSSTDSKNTKSPRVELPFGLSDVFSSGAFLVAGRVVAAAIFYASCLNVAICQYENIRSGMVGFQTRWEMISSWRRRLPQLLGGLLQGIGSWFSFSNRSGSGDSSGLLDDTASLASTIDFDKKINAEPNLFNKDEPDEDNGDDDDDAESDTSDSETEEEEERPRITFLDRVIC